MKRIKNYLLKVQEEFKGVSKGAVVVALGIESCLCLFLIGAMLVTAINFTASNALAENVIEINSDMEEKLYDAQVEAEAYKQLYDEAKQELTELKK